MYNIFQVWDERRDKVREIITEIDIQPGDFVQSRDWFGNIWAEIIEVSSYSLKIHQYVKNRNRETKELTFVRETRNLELYSVRRFLKADAPKEKGNTFYTENGRVPV